MDAGTMDRASGIELLVLDVDGVLTDGGLYFGADGEALKRFHVHDGAGIKAVMKAGIQVAVISARETPTVTARMHELGVQEVFQGSNDKLETLTELMSRLEIESAKVACVGDDLADVSMMGVVGLAIAVQNARPQALDAAHYRTSAKGGDGAVREVCDLLLAAR